MSLLGLEINNEDLLTLIDRPLIKALPRLALPDPSIGESAQGRPVRIGPSDRLAEEAAELDFH